MSLSVFRAIFYRNALLAGVLAVLGMGCDTVPESGRQRLLLIDAAQETQLGQKTFYELKRERPIARDRVNAERVRRVGAAIAQVVPLPETHWEFVLFEDPTPNAFALPGGKVGVNTGILPLTQDDAGLATVIAHEIAHVVARHSGERLSQQLLVQLGGAALGAALGEKTPVTRELALQVYGLGAQVGVILPYSRAHELEADALGLLYMARAGYDPRAAIDFWRRFAEYNARRGGETLEFLSTHPVDERRLAQLQELMPRAWAEYEQTKLRRRQSSSSRTR